MHICSGLTNTKGDQTSVAAFLSFGQQKEHPALKEMDFVDLVARDGFLDEELRHGKTFKARKQDPGTTYLKVCFLRFAHAPSPTTIDDDALSNFAFSVDLVELKTSLSEEREESQGTR